MAPRRLAGLLVGLSLALSLAAEDSPVQGDTPPQAAQSRQDEVPQQGAEMGSAAAEKTQGDDAAEEPLEEQVSVEQATQLLPKTRAMLARYPRCFRRCPGTVGPLDTMMGLHLSGRNGHAQGVACAHSGAFSCVYKTSNMFACYSFLSDEDWGSWSLPLPLTAGLFRRQCRGHSAKEELGEVELGEGAKSPAEMSGKVSVADEEQAVQRAEKAQGEVPQQEADRGAEAQDFLEESVSAEQAKQLLPKTRAMLARYPRCFRRCPGTVGPLDTMMGLHLAGRDGHAKAVACAHSGAFSCVYKTSNMFACYSFLSDEDWGSWSLPLPLTAGLFRRQCRGHAAKEAAGEGAEDPTEKASVAEEEHAAQPAENAQDAESGVAGQDALEEQVSAEQATQLLPKTRAMLARYPRCFRRCPGTVGPLDTMMGLHLSGRNGHAQGVACAHSGAFSCVYKTSNMFACYSFLSDEDWGSWSLPLPLTAGLFHRQCTHHAEAAANSVEEASAPQEIILP